MRAHTIALTMIIGLGAWLALGTTPALAQGATSDPADNAARKRAEAHYKIALEYHRLAEHYKAADEYLKAYALFPSPEFLYNVAQEYRAAGDHPKALFYYRKYIELDPNGRAVPAARRYIDALTHEIGNESAVDPSFPPKPPESELTNVPVPRPEEPTAPHEGSNEIKPTQGGGPVEPATGGDRANTDPEPAAKPEPLVAPAVTSTEKPRGNRSLKIAGLATAGVGAVSLLVGVKYALDVSSLESDIADTTEWTPGALDKFDQGESAETRMVIATSVGVAALVAGGALYFLGSRASSEERAPDKVVIAPVLAPTLTGIGVSGSF